MTYLLLLRCNTSDAIKCTVYMSRNINCKMNSQSLAVIQLFSVFVICETVPSHTSGSGSGGEAGECVSGFTVDGYNCTDINECGDNNKCHDNADCLNTLGSYQCSCKLGFSGDGMSCTDIDKCAPISHICDRCGSNLEVFDCWCNEGHYGGSFKFQSNLDKNGYNIKLEPYNIASCPFLPYKCMKKSPDSCRCPYNFPNIGFNCMVIDNCISGQNDCHKNAKCIPAQNGSYTCQCNSGFTGSGFQCTDVDECESFQPPCTNNCINTIGGYSCGCSSGYDGDHCTDIDECSKGTHHCHPRATCSNTDGSYYCTCENEYYVGGDNGTWCSGCIKDLWTPWTDFDHGYWISGTYQFAYGIGDFETSNLARKSYPSFRLCEDPTNIDVRLSNTEPYYNGGDKVHISIDGFYCLNNEQDDGICHNYHVRFCCPGSAENEFESSTQTDMALDPTIQTETIFASSEQEDSTYALPTTTYASTHPADIEFDSNTHTILMPRQTTYTETTFTAIEQDATTSDFTSTTHVTTDTTNLMFDSNTQSRTSSESSSQQTSTANPTKTSLFEIFDSSTSEIVSEYTCVMSSIIIRWTKSSIGSGYFYKLQVKDLKTHKIIETSVQFILPEEVYIKTTPTYSKGCITTTKLTVDTTNGVIVKVIAGKFENQFKTISKVIHQNGKQTYELTFID